MNGTEGGRGKTDSEVQEHYGGILDAEKLLLDNDYTMKDIIRTA